MGMHLWLVILDVPHASRHTCATCLSSYMCHMSLVRDVPHASRHTISLVILDVPDVSACYMCYMCHT